MARIRGLACRMAGFDAADELTQDVFIHAWEKLASFRSEAMFGTWLYRLAINLIVERRRSRARRLAFFHDDEDAVRQAAAPAADSVVAIDLEAALDRLPEGARQVFVLHDVEGFKHEEIGRLLDIAEGTSKGQLHRARMMLRTYLGGGQRRTFRGSHT